MSNTKQSDMCQTGCNMRPMNNLDNVYVDMMDNMRRFQNDFDRMNNSMFSDMMPMEYDPWMTRPHHRRSHPSLGNMPSSSALATTGMGMRPWTSMNTNTPKIDIQDVGDKIVVHGDVPGMNKETMKITVENGMMTIRGEKQDSKVEENKDENSRYYLKERSSSAFSRSFALPENVMEDDIKAKLQDGVLEVTIPKDTKAIKHHSKMIAIE